MENHHRRRIARTLQHQDKENEPCNNYPTPTELQALSVRGALGDLTPNVHPQRELNTDKNAVAAADFEKKVSSNRRYGRSNYSHIKANMDTGLAKKRIAPSSQPPPRREESKKGIAVAIKDDPKKQIEIKEPKNGKHVKKYNHLSPPKLPEYIEDIDADYNKNPLLMPMYIKNNYKHLKDLEEKYPIECDHLRKQTVITGEMRATLIDWLFAVYKEFSLLLETFHLTVGIIDRYLQAEPNLRLNRLQLVGLTAMFIASKYNKEIYSPELGDFLFVTDDVYSKYEALQCMIEILKKLGFNLSRPTPLTFLRNLETQHLGRPRIFI